MANSMKMRDWPSMASEVMLSMLPMPATAPSTFCMIWVSISCGEAPGCDTSTSTPGNEMSGLSVTGSRTKPTTPIKSSTANSTTGVTGWRIAQAEMFFMARGPLGLAARHRGDLHLFAVAQEARGGRDDALLAGEAAR